MNHDLSFEVWFRAAVAESLCKADGDEEVRPGIRDVFIVICSLSESGTVILLPESWKSETWDNWKILGSSWSSYMSLKYRALYNTSSTNKFT